MPKNFSININDFTGIHRAMAEKANINGGDTLDDIEISLFNDILNTYNAKTDTFFFENEFYNKNGNVVEYADNLSQPAVSTRIEKQLSPDKMIAADKNKEAVEKAKKYAKSITDNRTKTIVVNKIVNGKEVRFSYNIASLENYVMNLATDKSGHKINYFSNVEGIRNKPSSKRTKDECKLLSEFNNMISSAIKTGVDYGVDPKLILSIIEQEVAFQGLSDSVVGNSGKGYMQITTSPVADMLGGYTKDDKLLYNKKIKENIYGPELRKLLISRGFDPDCKPSERGKLKNQIMQYLKDNKDGDFNIRLGTLILRKYLNNSKGNVQLAAQKYNGKEENGAKYKYAKQIKMIYNKISAFENTYKT